MREPNYIVQFIRRDDLPVEEYIYPNRADAEHHFNLFRHDDSGLYSRICMLSWIGDDTTTLKEIVFLRSNHE